VLYEFDVDFEGHRIHLWEGGEGFPVLLLHGSGPGASTVGNWRSVINQLSDKFHVVATDLVGFGLSDRKRVPPYFDTHLWGRQARFVLDRLGADRVGVLAHSLSGSLAFRLAANDQRIVKVMTTGTLGARFESNAHLERVWTFPDSREALRLVAGCLVYDSSVITDDYIENRLAVLQAPGYASYFQAMFAGTKQQFIDEAVLTDTEVRAITCDVTLLHGRDDLVCPVRYSTLALAEHLPQADVVLLARCGHSPALEHPEKVISTAVSFFESTRVRDGFVANV
jgi:2-hydroxymuconate-semialdehyde hydrolase